MAKCAEALQDFNNNPETATAIEMLSKLPPHVIAAMAAQLEGASV
jgi:hypothetical protein